MSITFSYPDNYERKPVQDPADQWLCHDCKKPTTTYRCPKCQAKASGEAPRQHGRIYTGRNAHGAALMKPPRCLECICWHRQDGKAWWLGYCTITGESVGFRTTCQLPEWQKN